MYPALDDYLKKYIFDSPVLATELTEYFDAYKQQKVSNRISDDFITLVEKYASGISYAKLPTRDNAIKAIADKDNAYLYWIDALGVEYMSYITALAKKKDCRFIRTLSARIYRPSQLSISNFMNSGQTIESLKRKRSITSSTRKKVATSSPTMKTRFIFRLSWM